MSVTSAGRGTAWDPTQGFLQTMLTSMWLPYVVDAKNNASPLMSMIPTDSDRVAGKYLFMPVKHGRNTDAMSAVREGGRLPDPTSPKARPYMFRVRKNFARAVIDGDIHRASQMEAVRYVEPLQDIMDQMADDIAVEANRQLHNDGSGRLAELNLLQGSGGMAGAGQYELRLNSGIESSATSQSSPAQFLGGEYLGQRIAVYSPAGVFRGTRVVLSVQSETTTAGAPALARVTLADPLSPATPTNLTGAAIGDWVVRCASVGVTDVAGATTEVIHSAFRTEMPGIGGIFGDSFVLDGNGVALLPGGAIEWVGQDEFVAVSGATVGFQGAPTDGTLPFNQGIILDGLGVLRDPTDELLQTGFSKAEETNNGIVDFLMSGLGERDRFGDTQIKDKRWVNTTVISGGWTALDAKGKPWATDRMCYKNRIYGMGLKSGGFRQYVRTPFQPLEPFGPQWYRLQDEDKYQGAFVWEGTHGVEVRNRCGFLITDVRRNG